jgi:aflatoxin B1 aldehyde reductase
MSIRHGPPRGIILGLMTVGPEHSKDARVTSLDEFKRCLDLFQQRGYTELDTARGYAGGLQEGFTQKAGWKDRGLSIATKSYPTIAHPHWGEALRAQLEESLAELQTDSIDIFYLHAADRSVPFAETFEELNNLYREKKFKRLGLSNFSAFEVAEVTMMCNEKGWVRPSIYQGVYNAISTCAP